MLVVVGSFFFIGWRAIFVALLVWCMATQPGALRGRRAVQLGVGWEGREAIPGVPTPPCRT